MAVEVVKLLAPFCSPLTILPSFWYCWIGNQKRSKTPWTEIIKPLKCRIEFHYNKYYIHNCMTAFIGPTPPKIVDNWFFLMSAIHSCNRNSINLLKPSKPCRWTIRFSLISEHFRYVSPIKKPRSKINKYQKLFLWCNRINLVSQYFWAWLTTICITKSNLNDEMICKKSLKKYSSIENVSDY